MLRSIEDALERDLSVPERPERIVSLVPSVTELLFDLGAGERVVGVSRYCTEPRGPLERLRKVGGQKDPDLDEVRALAPDLVIAVKEENLQRDIEVLDGAGIPVYVADVRTLEDAVALIGEIGDLVDGESQKIEALRETVLAGIEAARRRAPSPPVKVFAPVWRDPWIAISRDTFMHEVIVTAGGAPLALGRRDQRYPKVTLDEVRAARPDVILLCDEPYAFTAADVAELSAIAPAAIVDGKLLQWYGSRTARIADLAETIARLCGR